MVAVGDVIEGFDQVPVLALADELDAVRAGQHREGGDLVCPELDQVARTPLVEVLVEVAHKPAADQDHRALAVPADGAVRAQCRLVPTASEAVEPSAVDSVTVIDGASRP